MSLLSSLADLLKAAPPPDTVVQWALERITDQVDHLLSSASGWEKSLSSPIHHALGYCEGLVAALPGPVDVTHHAFGRDPLVHALFATASDVTSMLGKSEAVRDYLETTRSWESDHFYALLAARRQEKHQLGLAMQGEVLRSDVPQTVLYFSDHLVLEPHPDLESTQTHLREAAFESLLKGFRAHVDALRQGKEALASDYSVERAHLAIFEGQKSDPGLTVHTRRLADLDAHLRQTAESLVPEHLVDALAAHLLAPERSLRLDPVSFRVDRLGVVADIAESQGGEVLSFPELISRDQRRHLVMLARINREEARQAVETTQDLQRRFLVI